MLYTAQMVKENIRNREGKRVFYQGADDLLTSEARDYLRRENIQLLPAAMARKERYALLSGGFCEEKPEHMTHLNGEILVPKTHPRILFRGAVDTLEAQLLLCQQLGDTWAYPRLQEALELAREVIKSDVLETPMPQRKLDGMDEAQLRSRSHRPQEYYGQPHFMPDGKDRPLLLQINLARCAARNAELLAANAFADRDGTPTRTDILLALNRLSSFLYLLMIQIKAKG